MPLTELAIRAAKPRSTAYKVFDSEGLFLLVRPGGSKLWRLKYRYMGKENVLSFGAHPVITLGEARDRRLAAKRLLANGIDPAAQRRHDKLVALVASRNTFGLIADDYIDRLKQAGSAEATISKTTWLLKTLAASLAHRPVTEITAAELLHLLQRIEASGRLETARRLRGTIGSVFRYAIVTLRAENDPTLALRGALMSPRVVGRAAITDEKKFGQLLRAIDAFDGWPTIKAALQFLLLTCVRPGEVRAARRAEFDIDRAVWEIPAERMKMREPHRVPLSRQAVAVLDRVWAYSEYGELVFPAIRSDRQTLSENAFNASLRRLGYGKDEVTAHGFRASASSILNERGYGPDVIEAVLAHRDPNPIRRAYNRATYWDQRVVLMQEWADLLDQLMQT